MVIEFESNEIKFGKFGQFWSCRDREERPNLKQDSVGSNPQPRAHEEGVEIIVPSYSVNNINMGPEHIDTQAFQAWR